MSLVKRKTPLGLDPLIMLTDRESMVLGRTPLGLHPKERHEKGQYRFIPYVTPSIGKPTPNPSKGLFDLWASWYFINWRLASDPDLVAMRADPDGGPDLTVPKSPWRRSALEAKRDTYTRALAGFLVDYTLIACMGEARHWFNYSSGYNRMESSNTCQQCLIVMRMSGLAGQFYNSGASGPRTLGSDRLWTTFENRLAAWDFLFHTNSAHTWPESMGGDNWAWLAGLGRVMDAALRMDNLELMAATIDALAFSHHAGSNFITSRFPWSHKIFTFWLPYSVNKVPEVQPMIPSFQTFLGWKQLAEECCWRAARHLIYPELVPESYRETPFLALHWSGHPINKCKHYHIYGIQQLEAQKTFHDSIKVFKKVCPVCQEVIGSNGKCSSTCTNGCDVCHNGVRCPLLCPTCHNLPQHCPGFCSECGACHVKGYHTLCPHCEPSTFLYGRSGNHSKRCRACYSFTRCPHVGNKCLRCHPDLFSARMFEGHLRTEAVIEKILAVRVEKKALKTGFNPVPKTPNSWKEYVVTLSKSGLLTDLPLTTVTPTEVGQKDDENEPIGLPALDVSESEPQTTNDNDPDKGWIGPGSQYGTILADTSKPGIPITGTFDDLAEQFASTGNTGVFKSSGSQGNLKSSYPVLNDWDTLAAEYVIASHPAGPDPFDDAVQLGDILPTPHPEPEVIQGHPDGTPGVSTPDLINVI